MAEGDLELARWALDAMDVMAEALIVWFPTTGRVEIANSLAREWRLVNEDGRLTDHLVEAAHAHRKLRAELETHGARSRATKFRRNAEICYLKISDIGDGAELIVCKPEVLRDVAVVKIMQDTFELSNRHVDVALNLLRCHSTRETAEILGIDQRTVRKHEEELRRKLGVGHNYEVIHVAEEIRWRRR